VVLAVTLPCAGSSTATLATPLVTPALTHTNPSVRERVIRGVRGGWRLAAQRTALSAAPTHSSTHSSTPLKRTRLLKPSNRKPAPPTHSSTHSHTHSSLPVNNNTNITVACITWNLQEMTPSRSDCHFLLDFRRKDLVVLGVQECEALKPRRQEGSRSIALKKQLEFILGIFFFVVVPYYYMYYYMYYMYSIMLYLILYTL
jgi:hypothetical protein